MSVCTSEIGFGQKLGRIIPTVEGNFPIVIRSGGGFRGAFPPFGRVSSGMLARFYAAVSRICGISHSHTPDQRSGPDTNTLRPYRRWENGKHKIPASISITPTDRQHSGYETPNNIACAACLHATFPLAGGFAGFSEWGSQYRRCQKFSGFLFSPENFRIMVNWKYYSSQADATQLETEFSSDCGNKVTRIAK